MWAVAMDRNRSKKQHFHHNMPDSARALWRIVSLTAAKTSLMFDVSVAWVRLEFASVKILGNNNSALTEDRGLNGLC